MVRRSSLICSIFLFILPNCVRKAENAIPLWQADSRALALTQAKEPRAARVAKTLISHGHERQDPYFWLNQREDQEVLSYLNAENEYTTAVMSSTEKVQAKLFEELKSRYPLTEDSAPYFQNGYFHYYRFLDGKDYPVYFRRAESMEGQEEETLDVSLLAQGHEFYDLRNVVYSPNNQLVAYSVDKVGRRQYEIFLKDLNTGELLPTRMVGSSSEVVWSQDSGSLFYVTNDPVTLRSDRVMHHVLGKPDEDKEVFFEKDDTFWVEIYEAQSNEFLFVHSSATLSSEVSLVPLKNPDLAPQVFLPRERGHRYLLDHNGQEFFIRTNWQAPNYRIMATLRAGDELAKWREIIGHREDVYLDSFKVFHDALVLREKVAGLNNLRVVRFDDSNLDYSLSHSEDAFEVDFGKNQELATTKLRYTYTSMTTPRSVYEIDMVTKEQTLIKQDAVLNGYNPKDYESERLYARARDGKAIAMTLVYRKGLVKDGQSPTLLYGYGSYGSSVAPRFNANLVSLLDRGFVFVIAHIRGSKTFGEPWYEDGKLLRKRNTFYDFIDCARYLIDHRFTSPNRLFVRGGSAGGLLIGAVINMNPELFRGAIAGVPFVDIVTTMLDDSIPLTTGEYDEWGNPNIKEYYEYMLSYSPYDNVQAQNYPALLVTTGLHDSQVQYWEPAKWVAKLRHTRLNDAPLLLKTDMSAGHQGKSGRFEYLRDTAFEYAFLLALLADEN